MAGIAGRAVTLEWDGAVILGVREKGITLNGEAINVTSDEDNGWRTLLDVTAEDSVDIALSGVTKDERLKAAYFGGAAARTKVATIEWPSGSTMTGTFFLANFSETGPYNDAVTFSATLQSSGPVVYTPAP
jgi:predicted secreted protein